MVRATCRCTDREPGSSISALAAACSDRRKAQTLPRLTSVHPMASMATTCLQNDTKLDPLQSEGRKSWRRAQSTVAMTLRREGKRESRRFGHLSLLAVAR